MSIHLYNAEKKDVKVVCDLMNEFKEVDLQELNYPEVDHNKLNTFIKIMLEKGKIILVKDLDLNQVIGCAIFGKTEYWFSKSECIHLHTIFVKKNFRNFKLVATLVDAIKKASEDLPIYLSVTSGLNIDPVFKKLGFESLGGNRRLN